MIVRKMQPIEFDSTINLFSQYFDEAVESIPTMAEEYDENSVMETIRHYASHWEYCWFNIYDGGRPVGFVAGFVGECPWKHDKLISNLSFIFLIQEHRNMDNFKQLLAKFEEWSRSVKAQQITAGDIGINIDRMQKLYEHFGFKPILLTVKELTE
jgi:GNAT superfamily N-acetyltransferase